MHNRFVHQGNKTVNGIYNRFYLSYLLQSSDFAEKVVAKFDSYQLIKINEIKWNPHVAQQIIIIDDNSVAQVTLVFQLTKLFFRWDGKILMTHVLI